MLRFARKRYWNIVIDLWIRISSFSQAPAVGNNSFVELIMDYIFNPTQRDLIKIIRP